MSDLVFSTQRDGDGDAFFSAQQVSSGYVNVFSEQRSASGKTIFASQTAEAATPVPDVNLQASLKSASNLTSIISIDQTLLAASLKSVSAVTATTEVQQVGLAVRILSVSFVRAIATAEVIPVNPEVGDIDATKVPLVRHVVFEGSKRMITFT